MELYQRVVSGGQASAADVQAIIQKCGVDRAVFAANLAAADAAAKAQGK